VKFTVRHQVQLVAESEMETSKILRLADVVHHLIAKSIVGLAVLKVNVIELLLVSSYLKCNHYTVINLLSSSQLG
jgi:hypothetical protein